MSVTNHSEAPPASWANPPTTARATAYWLFDLGALPVEIMPGTKRPRRQAWQETPIRREEVESTFLDGYGVGVVLGEPSGGLVDVDLDVPEAIALAGLFLPPTSLAHGRASRPSSHRWYRCPKPGRVLQLKDPVDGKTLVEVRGKGGQTNIPPTVHISGEPLAWSGTGEPALVDRADLEKAAGRIAFGSFVARHWPGEGSRHAASLALAGVLARAGLQEEEAADAHGEILSAAPNETEDRAADVRSTFERIAAGQVATGLPTLLDLLGVPAEKKDKAARSLAEWIGLSRMDGRLDPVPVTGGRPVVEIASTDAMLDAVWTGIARHDDPPTLFSMGEPGADVLVRLYPETGTLRTLTTPDAIAAELVDRMTFTRKTKNGDGWKTVTANPPEGLSRYILNAAVKKLPMLRRVVTAPTFSDDGKLAQVGYNPESGIFYTPTATVPPIPERPTAVDVEKARALLLDDLLVDFPLEGESDKANALAFLLQPMVRDLITSATPLYLVAKPVRGAGGTLLVRLASVVHTADEPVEIQEPEDGDEWRKAISAALSMSPTILLLDNVDRKLASPRLASAITSKTWTDRILGQTKMLRLANLATWVATGNNPSFSDEVARRVVPIRLNPRTDRPEDRTGFKHDPIEEWAIENRGALLWALAVLVANWIALGRRPGPKGLGSFESCTRTLGGILRDAGVDGFLDNRASLQEDSEEDLVDLVRAWYARHGNEPVLAHALASLAEVRDPMTGAVEHPLGIFPPRDQTMPKYLGYVLRRNVNRRFRLADGRLVALTKGEKTKNGTPWFLAGDDGDDSDDVSLPIGKASVNPIEGESSSSSSHRHPIQTATPPEPRLNGVEGDVAIEAPRCATCGDTDTHPTSLGGRRLCRKHYYAEAEVGPVEREAV